MIVASPLRRERVAEQVHHEISAIIQQDLSDPRKGWTTVTRVEMSPDLRYARVFVSVYGGADAKRDALRVLKHAAHFMRATLASRLRLREAPELHFVLDDSIERSQRILDLLRETDIPPAPPDEQAGRED